MKVVAIVHLTERIGGLENLVWTPRDFEGIKQSGVKDKILRFL